MGTNSKNILVVDDEPVNIKILTGMLATEDYNIIEANNGREALDTLEKHVPDMVLLDVMMPGMDGFEVCRRIKARKDRRLIPVVMVTALQDRVHRQQALEAGADDFLSKPIDRSELLIRIKSLLRIKEYSDELYESNRLLEEKKEELKRLEKAKEALTHMIVHDLRSPLTTISMNIDVCMMKLDEGSGLKRYLDNASYQCTRLDNMIQGLLDIYKMEKGKLELNRQLVDPNQLLREVASQYGPQMEIKQIGMNLAISQNSPKISMDLEIIRRVIANLLDNALRHTPAGGYIEIGLSTDTDLNSLVFSVSDTGEGIDNKYHNRIFDRFEQIKLKKDGVTTGSIGLGLAFCRMAVELHGGKIWVSNKSGSSGCKFSFSLPLESPKKS